LALRKVVIDKLTKTHVWFSSFYNTYTFKLPTQQR